jgi:hypothetical protein
VHSLTVDRAWSAQQSAAGAAHARALGSRADPSRYDRCTAAEGKPPWIFRTQTTPTTSMSASS